MVVCVRGVQLLHPHLRKIVLNNIRVSCYISTRTHHHHHHPSTSTTYVSLRVTDTKKHGLALGHVRFLVNRPVTSEEQRRAKIRDGVMYSLSMLLFMVGVSFAAVPLYKMFCSATGYSGTTQTHDFTNNDKIINMQPLDWRPLVVHFSGKVSPELPWEFYPVQKSVQLVPGETCLAFFTAKNTSDSPITGISTYNVTPFEAGAYFNKIQCFCFDEQTLNPGEELDMPVFFYIDPEFALDTTLIELRCMDVSLHYTFFDTKKGDNVSPIMEFVDQHIIKLKSEKDEAVAPLDVPEGAIKVNDHVYKELIRKGYEKEFIYKGATVVLHVKGSIKDTGRVFWSTRETGQHPFVFKAGVGQVISGWDEACEGMSEGEISRVTIGSNKAYGKKGNSSWNIAPNTDLVFEIEVMSVK